MQFSVACYGVIWGLFSVKAPSLSLDLRVGQGCKENREKKRHISHTNSWSVDGIKGLLAMLQPKHIIKPLHEAIWCVTCQDLWCYVCES